MGADLRAKRLGGSKIRPYTFKSNGNRARPGSREGRDKVNVNRERNYNRRVNCAIRTCQCAEDPRFGRTAVFIGAGNQTVISLL